MSSKPLNKLAKGENTKISERYEETTLMESLCMVIQRDDEPHGDGIRPSQKISHSQIAINFVNRVIPILLQMFSLYEFINLIISCRFLYFTYRLG